ncbi:MAG TPA: AMP-binding protein [Casimicrobiaceae bacterium]|nr:AMP-binding protein [Casimicrobiaceae bacterium]
MSDIALVAGHDGAPIACRGSRVFAVDEFIAAADLLARALPPAGFALLLCEDRVSFATAFCALAMRGTTALLPPSHAPHALASIVATRRPGFALVDRVGIVSGLMEVAVDADCTPPPSTTTIPAIDAGHVAAIVYTSGTTGEPQPHEKTWRSLTEGAAGLRARIAFARGDAIIGAVPAQHMWGLEATVMLALQGGGAIDAATPLLPHEIVRRLAQFSARRWLVLTPLHARSIVRSDAQLPALAGTLSATAALDAETARSIERLTSAPAIEIYGSSETGVIATRHPACESNFDPLAGITLDATQDNFVVSGAHVKSVTLNDRIRVNEDGSFALLGRDSDLVKVGGKRASLAMLNAALRSIAGVVDAECVVRDYGALSVRVAAIVVAPGVTREAIVAALRDRIDPVFLPRPLYLVDALPRNAIGKIAADALTQTLHELEDSERLDSRAT